MNFFADLGLGLGAAWATMGLMTVLRVAAMVLIGALVIRFVMQIVDRMLEKAKNLASLSVYIRSTVRIGLWFLLALIVLDSLGIPVTSVLAMFGVAGLAVSLALQNTLSNLAGGIQILVTKPFVVGDFIDTEKGCGTVQEIGLAYSKLLTIDNRALLIPNSTVAGSKIENFTSTGKRRVDITFTAAYDCPIAEVQKATLDTVAMFNQVITDPAAPEVHVTGYGASSIDYVVRAWVETADYWTVYFGILENLLPTFTKMGVEMSYNHMNVHMIDKK